VAAEDLTQDTYLKFILKPPTPQTPVALHRWLRTVMVRLHTDAYRRDLKRGEPRHTLPLEELG
jgi:DNA-directed RNA polymerase specialized sigma24 family protein